MTLIARLRLENSAYRDLVNLMTVDELRELLRRAGDSERVWNNKQLRVIIDNAMSTKLSLTLDLTGRSVSGHNTDRESSN